MRGVRRIDILHPDPYFGCACKAQACIALSTEHVVGHELPVAEIHDFARSTLVIGDLSSEFKGELEL
ncbi:MAG: hypothetical protein HC927_00170 [Deltaproteobacteria bacterium]|nr:hypothetical protein [Deltaproteobacteria bacterium]